MKNRGKVVKEKIRELGIKINTIGPKIDYDDVYMYRKLDQADLEWEIIRKIGLAINYDFSKDFPEMPFILNDTDSSKEYGNPDSTKDIAYWKDKYIKTLEKLNENLVKKKQKK